MRLRVNEYQVAMPVIEIDTLLLGLLWEDCSDPTSAGFSSSLDSSTCTFYHTTHFEHLRPQDMEYLGKVYLPFSETGPSSRSNLRARIPRQIDHQQ